MSGLPFNKYTWLVTHNSFSMVDAPSLTGAQRITFYNQEDTVTNQLRVCNFLCFHSTFTCINVENRIVLFLIFIGILCLTIFFFLFGV